MNVAAFVGSLWAGEIGSTERKRFELFGLQPGEDRNENRRSRRGLLKCRLIQLRSERRPSKVFQLSERRVNCFGERPKPTRIWRMAKRNFEFKTYVA